MKKIILLLIIALVGFSLAKNGVFAANSVSWYTVRNSEHKQPILDGTLSFVEKYGALYVDKAHGDQSEDKVIYLTFDVGYENGNVARVLDILKEEKVTGAFFLLAHAIQSQPALMERMEQEGHLLCNHTVRHKDMSALGKEAFEEELRALEKIYSECREGKRLASFYRPPEGKFSKENLDYAKSMGYKTVFWSLTYADWNDSVAPSDETAKKILMDNTHNGAIVLLHPTSDINVRILRDMITYWKNEGYRFGSLEEL